MKPHSNSFKNQKRTLAQNSAMHLFFGHVAEALNAAGYDLKKTVKIMRDGGVDIPWSPIMVKDILWRTIQETRYGKHSTTELSKQKEIDEIHEILNRFLGERMGIEYIPFPSLEVLEQREFNK